MRKSLTLIFIIFLFLQIHTLFTISHAESDPIFLNKEFSAVSSWFQVKPLSFAGLSVGQEGYVYNPTGPDCHISVGDPTILNITDAGYIHFTDDKTLFLKIFKVRWTLSIVTIENKHYIEYAYNPIQCELLHLERGDFSITSVAQSYIQFPNYNVSPNWEDRADIRTNGSVEMQIVIDTGSVFGINGAPERLEDPMNKGYWDKPRPIATIKGVFTGRENATRDYLENGPSLRVVTVATDEESKHYEYDTNPTTIQTGTAGGKSVTGYYIGPEFFYDPVTETFSPVQRITRGYHLYSSPPNTQIPTDDGYGLNISELASLPNHDPRVYERNLTVAYAHSYNSLGLEVTLLRVKQLYHYEWKRVTRVFAIVCNSIAETRVADTIVGLEVKNVFIQQPYECYVLVGSYYDWNPFATNRGDQGTPTADISEDIFDGVPSGTREGRASAYNILDWLGQFWYIFVLIGGILLLRYAAKFRGKRQLKSEGRKGSGTEALLRSTSKMIGFSVGLVIIFAALAFFNYVFQWWLYLAIFGGVGAVLALYCYSFYTQNKALRNPQKGDEYNG
jgi:hypothetical protein